MVIVEVVGVVCETKKVCYEVGIEYKAAYIIVFLVMPSFHETCNEKLSKHL
jgi:hypothetical protein